MPVTLPESATKSLDFKDTACETVYDHTCMAWEFNDVLNEIIKKCPKNCVNVQFTGKSTFLLPISEDVKFSRKYNLYFVSTKTAVEEEYLIMDFTGLIGAIGGTLGLFIGFSFKEITTFLVDGLEWILRKSRPLSSSSSTRILTVKE